MVFKKQTYSTVVAGFIKRQIQQGELLPGQAIKEVALAEHLGISRAPVREALESLARDGLVTSEPQKGKRVRLMTPEEIRHSYSVGGILEATGVADSLPQWTDAEVDELDGVLKGMYKNNQTPGVQSCLSELDEIFHDRLLKHCHNHQLVSLARHSCATISKYLMYRQWTTFYSFNELYERHVVLVEAMRRRNRKEIWYKIREHYEELGEYMAQLMERSGWSQA